MSEDPAPSKVTRPPTPRWVKAFGLVALILGVLVVLKLTGVAGEGHGPGRHGGAARPDIGMGGQTSSS